jgi:hypothetical protein
MRSLGDVERNRWCNCQRRLWANIKMEVPLIREWISISIVAKHNQSIVAAYQLVLRNRAE